MTKSLTEQWENEELKDGFYFINVDFGDGDYIDIVKYSATTKYFLRYRNDNIKEVLAPVPSYDEWQAELDSNDELLNVQKRLEKQLAIATKALKEINKNYRFTVAQDVVYKALEEMEGVK